MAQPHDHLFQVLFSDPEHGGPLLRSALPPSLVAAIDWSTLTRRPAGQRTARGGRTICDVLFTARTREHRPLLLYLVLEHKSQGHRFDALQLLEQVVAVLRTHRREHPGDRHLPPVLPIVVHADHRPWRSPLQLTELFDTARVPADLQRHLPSFEYLLDDLHDQPPTKLRERALTVFGLCALAALQYLPAAGRDVETFAAWVDEWRDVHEQAARMAAAGTARDAYDAVVHYILVTSDLPRRQVHRVLQQRLSSSAMKNFRSTLDQTREEGKAEGRAVGKAEGRAELVLRQLHKRFGAAVTPAVEQRVRAASLDELDRYGERLLDAASIDEVFAEGS